ncbi:MAG: PQQ-dependent sugar dehydrogenase [Bacteroidetes bacterium]|nr:PQQ-dependent sugar dehydrogenase [Bacteroidota bacterium]
MASFKVFVLAFAVTVVFSAAHAQYELENAYPNLTFSQPVDFQHAGDGSNRVFVVEQQGMIKVFDNADTSSTARVFLDIAAKVLSGGELGLLGLAFHPDYEMNGYFFVNYTASTPRRTVVARFEVSSPDPDAADPASELLLLEVNQPFQNHNGGQIGFGPDGYLYISFGDGGSGGDPQGHGQNLSSVLGSIARIDVDNPSGQLNYGIPPDNPFTGSLTAREEIYAYGLRNAWRFSIDSASGRIWAADVGQDRIEEIDLIEKGKNYGWKIMEGTLCFSPGTGCDTSGLALPVWEYGRSLGNSVTGGYVYRGARVPELGGRYVYGDFGSGRIWALTYDGVNPPTNEQLLVSGFAVSSFGVDENKELYILQYSPGRIHRFKPSVPTSVEEEVGIPIVSRLLQNYPNPFNPSTMIEFFVPVDGPVRLEVYDMSGERVATLADEELPAGRHSRRFLGSGLATGIYVYRLTAGAQISARKMILTK